MNAEIKKLLEKGYEPNRMFIDIGDGTFIPGLEPIYYTDGEIELGEALLAFKNYVFDKKRGKVKDGAFKELYTELYQLPDEATFGEAARFVLRKIYAMRKE